MTPRKGQRRWYIAGTFAFALFAMVLGVAFGTESFGLMHLFDGGDSIGRAMLLSVRLPRVLLGALAGAGLSVVGAAFQGVLRNPLAEPYVLGVSGGAALGATIVLALGLSATTVVGAGALPVAALVGGLLTTVVVLVIAARGEGASATSMLLAGVVINAIASSLMTLIRSFMSSSRGTELLYWLMGFIEVPSWTTLGFVALYVTGGALVLIRDAGRLNLLALGDASAGHLGVDVRTLQRRVLIACSCIIGAVVSVTGLIGFVGLVVPHTMRRLVGPDARVLLPASMFAGAGLLVLCDLAGRMIFRLIHTEPPVGALTALLGGPLFLSLLSRPSVRSEHE